MTFFRYELFLENSDLHVFRAVEPALRRRWFLKTCFSRRGVEHNERCERSNAEGNLPCLGILSNRQEGQKILFPIRRNIPYTALQQ